jgi:hypothetical protein
MAMLLSLMERQKFKSTLGMGTDYVVASTFRRYRLCDVVWDLAFCVLVFVVAVALACLLP